MDSAFVWYEAASITFRKYGLHHLNYWAVCFHLLGYFVPLGCYCLSGWNRRNPMVRLEKKTESEKRLIQRLRNLT